MRSTLLLICLALVTPSVMASACQVYGISDSPQKLDCSFKHVKVALRCQNGTYYLNSSKVLNAFHMDVEEGSAPLVFEAKNQQLTIVIEPKVDIQAELRTRNTSLFGTCL